MGYRDIRETLENVHTAIYEEMEKQTEDKIYSHQLSMRYNASDLVDEAIEEYLKAILQDEKLKTKLAKQVSKKVLAKHDEHTKKEKEELRKNRKLWRVTKGKIPCINECGFYRNSTEDEVLTSSNKFLCGACYEKLNAESSSASYKVFEKDIYKICGAE